MSVLNYRHRMAQQASRSSVELYTNLFFKDKAIQEEGHVIRVMKNGFSVLIPRYGIEGYVYASPTDSTTSPFTYNGETNQLVSESATIKLFARVTVLVAVEEAGVAAAQRSKLVLRLVDPVVPGLSVDSIIAEQPPAKKAKVEAKGTPKKGRK
ncbi:hypothetical protein BDK51DRAFT_46976 [Blyttiomyces helicus]|uniref:Exosome complex exonuclease RRP44 S1 domain-containing protein n=1 Tax=Blyttiomyces helicus TaxID=388810 RepID=A0A4P9VYB8_9FUNG|nr:hypothetical protein BDK51DRAFT_46976 [Blyttiomyces helicus]|eukprot:RKO83298.1 hypothetical protein BDK51DRAFT_46976 [Blyttiomyces helicus]